MSEVPATPGPDGLFRGFTTRRTLLRTGLVVTPVALVGIWAGNGRVRPSVLAPRSAGAQMPSCIVTPQVTEGPYFVDEQLFRSDIRDDPSNGTVKDGVPLRLGFRVLDVTGGMCTGLAGAVLDVWHCDALGVYSDVSDPGGSTLGQQFLRGTQYLDANGAAEFLTIYPGWYQGRTVHIHFKVRTDPDLESGYEFTSQLFFDDALSDVVYQNAPYVAKGERDTRNSDDGIYGGGGEALLLEIIEDGDGYATVIEVGVDTSVAAQMGGPGGPGGPGMYPPPRDGDPPPIQGFPAPGATPTTPATGTGSAAPVGPAATPPAQQAK